MRIDVTLEDIQRGLRCSDFACPIALAVRRATGSPWVSVLGTIGFMSDAPSIFARGDTPDAVLLWMKAFDSGAPVKPFSFELNVKVRS